MTKLTDKDFKYFELLYEATERQIVNDLGVALQYEYAPPGCKFSAPYSQMGRQLWNAIRNELYAILCNQDTQTPKEWINDVVTGDIRNLATGIVSAITAKYDVSLGIAIPVTALIIKKGILKYCSETIKSSSKTVNKILNDKKDAMLEFKKDIMQKRKLQKKSKRK